MSALHVNDQSFAADVLQSDVPVLVDFWAPWCPPCRMMGPVVDELAGELAGKARVVKVNVDEAPQTARQFRISSIPGFAVVRDGQVKQQALGAMPKERLLSMLKPHLN